MSENSKLEELKKRKNADFDDENKADELVKSDLTFEELDKKLPDTPINYLDNAQFDYEKFGFNITSVRSLMGTTIRTRAALSVEGDKQKSIMDIIYERINMLFGGTSNKQLFVMEFPGRVLNEAAYAYDCDGHFYNLKKPQTVLEDEFRISNDMYDISVASIKPEDPDSEASSAEYAQIIAGPQGLKMSEMYIQSLNTLVPRWDMSKDLIADQAKIRKWLDEEVEDTIDGERVKCSRIELFVKLNERYLNKKADWEWLKNDLLVKGKAKAAEDGNNNALENYAKWLANEAPVAQAEIDNYFADLIMRGYYHEVKGHLAYLDVSSLSEHMYEAKSSLRHSSMSSLDETETIYPVNMQPNDWFRALNTDFRSEDLLLDPELLQKKLMDKEVELETSEYDLALMMGKQSGYEEKLKELKTAIDQHVEAIAESERKIQESVTKVALEALKIGINMYVSDKAQALKYALGLLPKSYSGDKPTETDLDKVIAHVNEVSLLQEQIQTLSRNLSALMLQEAEAAVMLSHKEIETLNRKVISLRKEINYLKAIIYSKGEADDDIVPLMPPPTRWVDIIFSIAKESVNQKTTLAVSNTLGSSKLMFGFLRGDFSVSASSYWDEIKKSVQDIQLGFRATKVTINRGWFRPQFFKQTKDMYTLGATKVNELFPAYPVAFIIVKDLTIKYKLEGEDTEKMKSVLNATAGASGGFLFFSAHARTTSKQETDAFSWKKEGEYLTIRIPGPQIIGWILNLVPKDMSSPYSKMPSYYLPEKV